MIYAQQEVVVMYWFDISKLKLKPSIQFLPSDCAKVSSLLSLSVNRCIATPTPISECLKRHHVFILKHQVYSEFIQVSGKVSFSCTISEAKARLSLMNKLLLYALLVNAKRGTRLTFTDGWATLDELRISGQSTNTCSSLVSREFL